MDCDGHSLEKENRNSNEQHVKETRPDASIVELILEIQLMPQFSGDRRNLRARRELRLRRIIVDGDE